MKIDKNWDLCENFGIIFATIESMSYEAMGLDDFDEKIAWLSDEKKKKMPLIKKYMYKKLWRDHFWSWKVRKENCTERKKFLPKKFITQHMFASGL
mgnify:FL=1